MTFFVSMFTPSMLTKGGDGSARSAKYAASVLVTFITIPDFFSQSIATLVFSDAIFAILSHVSDYKITFELT
jgi:hypothetical protein